MKSIAARRIRAGWKARVFGVTSNARKIHGFFDQDWYDAEYGLSQSSLSGFDHYLRIGVQAGHSPNADFDEDFYRSFYSDVREAVERGEFVNGFEHFVLFGAKEGRLPTFEISRATEAAFPGLTKPVEWDAAEAISRKPHSIGNKSGWKARIFGAPSNASEIHRFFDQKWYDAEYGLSQSSVRGFDHYLQIGIHAGNSPNADFDEGFYRSFYCDVREAVERGEFLSGFEHFVLNGRKEGRLPKHEISHTTELAFPGLTKAVELDAADAIARRLRSIPAKPGHGAPCIWFLVPNFNPDIFFGGYKAGLELVRSFHRQGWTVKIVICGHPTEDGRYALWSLGRDPRFRSFVDSVKIFNRDRNQGLPLEVGPNDRIISYSCWEAFLAHDLAKFTREPRFISLIQEDESIFHEYGSEHAILCSAYNLPQFPIFNSRKLQEYFQAHSIGVFRSGRTPEENRDFAVFEHVLSEAEKPTVQEMRDRSRLRFAMYARPECHARRNLFAVGLLALRQSIDRGHFAGDWEFVGVGSSLPGSVELGRHQRMEMLPKMDGRTYRKFLKSVDVGLSLMYSPHPGLVAFEMASAGARVVTNIFDNRSEDFVRSISSNLIPCQPSISGVADALMTAASGVGDCDERERGMHLCRIGASSSWDTLFDSDFHRRQLHGVIPPALRVFVSKKADEYYECTRNS